MSEWIANSAIRRFADAHFAWLSLDEGDNDPARFLAYLVASLQMVEAGIGSGTLAASQVPQPVPVEKLLAALRGILSRLWDLNPWS